MAYIGNNPDAIQNSIEITRFNGTGACTQFQIPQDVDDAKAIEVLVNSVQQDPDNSYSVTNGLITFSEAPSVGTNNVTVLRRTGLTFTRTQIDVGDILPNAVTTIAIADGSITAAKIANGTIVTAEIADGAVTGPKLGLTAINANNIVDGAVTGPKLGANSVSSNNIISSLALTGNVSVTGNVTVGAGTVANPAISVVGDTNTGIFFPAADTIAFTEGGTESMRINASGDLGIGTSSPAARLDVRTTSSTQATFTRTGQTAVCTLFQGSADTYLSATNSGANLILATQDVERMRIDSSGRVTMPYQPAFDAYSNAGGVTFTTEASIAFNSTTFNVGNHYNTSNYRFTAPVTGIYFFRAHVYKQSSGNASRLRLQKNAADVRFYTYISASDTYTHQITGIISLTAGDYVICTFGSDGAGTSIYLADNHSNFSGYLLG